MPEDFAIADYIRALQQRPDTSPEQIRQAIEHWAATRDTEASNRLLKTLVFKYAAAEKELYRLNRELLDKREALHEDLAAAAEIQRSLLPRKPADYAPFDMDWVFAPSTHIAGDIFNVIRLGDHLWGLYSLDVSGHGVPAAMVAVSVYQYLQPSSRFVCHPDPRSTSAQIPLRPAHVLRALDAEYPFERFSNFFTMAYMILDTDHHTLTYSNAGHPRPVILRRDGRIKLLKRGGPFIGLLGIRSPDDDDGFMEEQLTFNPGDKLFLYTDGLNEYMNPEGEMYGNQRLHAMIQRFAGKPLSEAVEAIRAALSEFGRGAAPADDMTLVGLELKK
ncbi:MAG: PP2C family protein-serine/threonine phosphatase [Hyphomicrobiales bacterium]